jgi:tRNA nucleotidyltransferase (CCA-adding enzyme)
LENGVQKNIQILFKDRLGRNVLSLLEKISQVADQFSMPVFAVGGFVRDLLLNISNKDIDIAVEGDGILFASRLAEELGGKITTHEKFGTAVVLFPDGNRIDVAMTRLEFYAHPAALPTVKQSSIKSDLHRRDFTINSLAVKLNEEDAFCLLDFLNGERDIKNKKIDVLHDSSFIEDPCRLFRAIRFEQRYDFRIGRQTEALMREAIKKRLVDSLSGTRFLNEMILILKENHPLKYILRMKELGLLQFVSPQMMDTQALKNIPIVLSGIESISLPEEPEIWYVYFLSLLYCLDEESFAQTAKRFQMQAWLKKSLIRDRGACNESLKLLEKDKDWSPETIYNQLSGFSVEAVIYFLAVASTDRANQYANTYFTQYHKQAELSLTGDDLVGMGIKPGPVFQSVFKALREAHVKGAIETREEEVAWVKKQFLEQ